MKRYHVSFLRHTIFYVFSLTVFIFMGIKDLIYPIEGDGLMSFIFPFMPYIWFASAMMFTLTLINVYRKRIYLEVNESSIIYRYGRNKIVYSYDDAKYYTIRPSGKQRILNVYSIKKDYAFHSGGRKEFQFNIGEDLLNNEMVFRYGLAFYLYTELDI